jgi:hypothetical protein
MRHLVDSAGEHQIVGTGAGFTKIWTAYPAGGVLPLIGNAPMSKKHSDAEIAAKLGTARELAEQGSAKRRSRTLWASL